MSNHQTNSDLNKTNKHCDKQANHKPLIVRYTEALKAMLDVLPDNTDRYPVETIDNYLWVIEKLLGDIYDLLKDKPGLNPDQIFNEFEISQDFIKQNNFQQLKR